MADLHTAEDFNKKRAELEQDLEERRDDLPPANILVAGITGTGKSTLLNAIFGKNFAETGTGRPVTEHMSEYHSEDIPIRIWDTVGLELDSEKTRKSIGDICAKIAEMAEHPDPYDKVHAIWYCINSNSNRYQGAELEFIKKLHSLGVPFIIVMTQCSGDEDEVNAFQKEIERINSSMGLNDVSVVQVLAQPVKFRGMPEPIEPFGLEELVSLTCKKLPEFIVKGFVAAQKVSQREKRAESECIIYDYAEQAMKGFWDKVPLINVFTTDSKIKNMFQKLGLMYNTVLSEDAIDKISSGSNIDFHNSFWGLIAPLDMGYSDKITKLFENKKNAGFSVEAAKIDKRDRAARMIAFYGYTFIDSIEELWETSTEEQLKNIQVTVDRLIDIINKKLRERKTKTYANTNKK